MNPIYKHRNGDTYMLMGIANQYVDDSEKWPLTAVYASCDTGKIYCRPMSEFELKFERVV